MAPVAYPPADPSHGPAGSRTPGARPWLASTDLREYVHVDSRLESGQGLPRHLPTDRRNGRRRWSLGALFAQVFLISVYIAIWNSGKPPAVIAGSLALLLAFSLIYIFQVGRIMQAPLVHRVLVVAVLFLLTIPQFAILGPDAAALWIYVGVAGGLVFGSTLAFAIGLALSGLMLLIDALTGQPLSWELALTLFALTAFMVGLRRQRPAEHQAAGNAGATGGGGGGRRTRTHRPGSARHPRPFADGHRGEGRPGPSAARARRGRRRGGDCRCRAAGQGSLGGRSGDRLRLPRGVAGRWIGGGRGGAAGRGDPGRVD